ncbi:MAG: HAD family hydrolase [Fimbriimonadaceae bacterium]
MWPSLVVFDMAGTTVHDRDYVNLAVIEGFRVNDFDCSISMINPLMGIAKPRAIEMVLREAKDSRSENADYVNQVHEDFLKAIIGFYESDLDVREVAGAGMVFQNLRSRGCKVALDTGFSRETADVILRRLGWDDSVIDFSVTSDEVENGRPYADMIFLAMNELDILDPLSVAKVGDTPSDMGQGIAAGCGWVIGVSEGTHTEEQLIAAGATHVIPNVSYLFSMVFDTEN